MAVQPIVMFPPTLITATVAAAQTLYTLPTAPASLQLAGGRFRFANTTTGTVAVTAFAVASGAAATITSLFLNAETIAANSHLDTDVPVLGPGGSYQTFAGTTAVVTVSQLSGLLLS